MNLVSAASTSNLPAVPRSSRQLITGEAASQCTNLPAENPAAVRVQTVDHRSTVGGSYAPIIMGTDEDPLWLWRERRKRGDQPEDLSKCRCYGANAGPAPVGSNIGAVFCVNAAFFLGRLLRRTFRILLLFVSMNRRLRNGALDKVSSNQLVPSRPQGRLR
jgi:hypothetical protein